MTSKLKIVPKFALNPNPGVLQIQHKALISHQNLNDFDDASVFAGTLALVGCRSNGP